MSDIDSLHHVEQVHQFRYPPSFWERWHEFVTLVETEWFQANYPAARLVVTNDEVWAVRLVDPDLPADLIPFMVVGGQQFPDYYGFQIAPRVAPGTAELPVLVWCIHAYVHSWDTGFGALLDDLQAQGFKYTPPSGAGGA